jgi:mono/diheme cytochrome c family protein
MKIFQSTLLIAVVSLLAVSCKDNGKPNYQYFPNMYESVGYETYSESKAFKNGQEAQLPVKGTIKRGFVPYEFENTTQGYELAKATSKSPLDSLSRNLDKGKELFDIYCAICHGATGNGKGKLVEREKFLGVPSYADRQITEGSIYHVITYGLNSMGSHANQLSSHERWLVTDYVLKLKSEL